MRRMTRYPSLSNGKGSERAQINHWRGGAGVLPGRVSRRAGVGTGMATGRTRAIRLLCALAVLVAVVLRGRSRALSFGRTAMWAPALFLRRARALAPIRKRLSG